jgi:hypothetical protein
MATRTIKISDGEILDGGEAYILMIDHSKIDWSANQDDWLQYCKPYKAKLWYGMDPDPYLKDTERVFADVPELSVSATIISNLDTIFLSERSAMMYVKLKR